MPQDILTPSTLALRKGKENLKEDLQLAKLGVLDKRGLINGYRQVVNPVEARTTSLIDPDQIKDIDPLLIVRDPSHFTDPVTREDGLIVDRAFGNRARYFREIRRSKNLRTTAGRDNWQRILMGGDIAANLGVTGTATTAPTATTFTMNGVTASTNQYAGHIVVTTSGTTTYGVIRSNTNATPPVATIDQWYTIGSSTGAAATTPTAGAFAVLPGQSPAMWLALDSTVTAPAAGATALGSEETTNGLVRVFQPCTFPSAGQYQYVHTWTYTGAVSKTIYNVGLFDSGPGTGGTLFLFTALSASATVNANGDTIQITWTITL